MTTLYREINASDTIVSEADYPQVVAMLQNAGWSVSPTKMDNGIFVFPKFDEAMEDIQPLKDLAAYIVTKGKIIVEVQETGVFPKTWLHLIFDGAGGVQEVSTPAFQWDID